MSPGTAVPSTAAVSAGVRATSGGRMPVPFQDPAVAAPPSGVGALLIGGLSAADTSIADIHVVHGARVGVIGRIPQAMHDAAAVMLGGTAYLFGGGDGTAQHGEIDAVNPATGAVTAAGTLPAPSSDQSAAVLDGIAYVVGGYTGTRWLDTIVAWRPGGTARVVAHLPQGVRYAAVTAASGHLVIAGGTTQAGAVDRIFLFTPGRGVRPGGRLPAPTTHAAAATHGGTAYIIGGRGDAAGSTTDRVVAVDARGHAHTAGHLVTAVSDAAAVDRAAGVWVYGGHTRSATTDAIQVLRTGTSEAAPVGTSGALHNVYAADTPGNLRGPARRARYLVYVPDTKSDTLDVIDPRTRRVIAHYAVGAQPQHVVPAWDLRTLYVLNDVGNSLTPINPRTGRPAARTIPVDDPYNMYFTPDGSRAIVVAERFARLDFRDPRTMALRTSLSVPCTGVDHMDFSADGTFLLASCEFSGRMVKVDLRGARPRVVGTLRLGSGGAMPQDVKLSPDGRVFYVADMASNGVWTIDAHRLRVTGFLRTGAGAHGLYPSRDARLLYVTNRGEGSITLISFATGRIVGKWRIPGGGSPDMGGVSPDGRTLWLSGRYNNEVYAIDTRTGRLQTRIPVGDGPHGLLIWPQPGNHSLGHTGNMR
ncbi:MAG: YncE family protein [Thermoleophilia bacterium]